MDNNNSYQSAAEEIEIMNNKINNKESIMSNNNNVEQFNEEVKANKKDNWKNVMFTCGKITRFTKKA